MNPQPENLDDEENGPYKSASGRAAFFGGLTVKRTWAGLLIGDPEKLTASARRDKFSNIAESMIEENKPMTAATVIDDGWAVLPGWQWTAQFTSSPINYDEDEDWDMQSELIIRWFTEEIPTDFQQMLIDMIKKVNWEETAKDCSTIF